MALSPSVSIVVEAGYSLALSVSPETGRIGDTFQFVGVLGSNGAGVIGEVVTLVLEGVGIVGQTTTSSSPIPGWYSINWTADRVGTLTFHTEAPNVGAASPAIAAQVYAVEPPPIPIGLLLLGGLVIALLALGEGQF